MRFLIYLIVVLWLLGLLFHVAGVFIHALLVVAIILLLLDVISGKRRFY